MGGSGPSTNYQQLPQILPPNYGFNSAFFDQYLPGLLNSGGPGNFQEAGGRFGRGLSPTQQAGVQGAQQWAGTMPGMGMMDSVQGILGQFSGTNPGGINQSNPANQALNRFLSPNFINPGYQPLPGMGGPSGPTRPPGPRQTPNKPQIPFNQMSGTHQALFRSQQGPGAPPSSGPVPGNPGSAFPVPRPDQNHPTANQAHINPGMQFQGGGGAGVQSGPPGMSISQTPPPGGGGALSGFPGMTNMRSGPGGKPLGGGSGPWTPQSIMQGGGPSGGFTGVMMDARVNPVTGRVEGRNANNEFGGGPSSPGGFQSGFPGMNMIQAGGPQGQAPGGPGGKGGGMGQPGGAGQANPFGQGGQPHFGGGPNIGDPVQDTDGDGIPDLPDRDGDGIPDIYQDRPGHTRGPQAPSAGTGWVRPTYPDQPWFNPWESPYGRPMRTGEIQTPWNPGSGPLNFGMGPGGGPPGGGGGLPELPVPTGPTGPTPPTGPPTPWDPGPPTPPPNGPLPELPPNGFNYGQMNSSLGMNSSSGMTDHPQPGSPQGQVAPPTSIYDTYQAGRDLMQETLDHEIGDALATSGFSGNRYGSAAANAVGRVAADATAGLNKDFTDMLYQQGQSDLDRQLQAVGLSLGFQGQNADRDIRAGQLGLDAGRFMDQGYQNRINQLLGAGQGDTQNQSMWDQLAYQDYERNKLGPLAWLSPYVTGTPLQQPTFAQHTTGGSPGAMEYIAALAPIIAAFASDERLKTNVKKDGEKIGPLQPVSWKWKHSGEKDSGFLAQDVEKHYPEAVFELPKSGIKVINAVRLFQEMEAA